MTRPPLALDAGRTAINRPLARNSNRCTSRDPSHLVVGTSKTERYQSGIDELAYQGRRFQIALGRFGRIVDDNSAGRVGRLIWRLRCSP